MTKVEKPHAALLASPGMGHLIPFLQLAKQMVTHHDFHVTLFVVASNIQEDSSSLLVKQSPIPNDHPDIVVLPSVDIAPLVDPDASLLSKLLVHVRESLPSLRSSIAAMTSRPTALVVDLFGADAFAVADEFGMLKYVFDTTAAWYLAVTFLSSSNIDLMEEHAKGQKPLQIPGCRSLRYEDTPESFLKIDGLVRFQHMATEISESDGILINTCEDLEPKTIASLRDKNLMGGVAKVPPIYPVGPLIIRGKLDGNDGVLDKQVQLWLDKQPSESVIYVSFGSGGTLSAAQMTELAWGLEQSKQRFIWVARPPSNNAMGTYFTIAEKDGDGNGEGCWPEYLPAGFRSRTKEMGLVIPRWGPQAQILSHPSVGGFLSHCGWNSTLESILNGVPMIAWPLYAEQKMNAAMVTEEFGIAVRPKVSSPSTETVGRDEVEELVRKIMAVEGNAMRIKVKELRHHADKALSKGGSSYNSLSQLAKHCLHRLHA